MERNRKVENTADENNNIEWKKKAAFTMKKIKKNCI